MSVVKDEWVSEWELLSESSCIRFRIRWSLCRSEDQGSANEQVLDDGADDIAGVVARLLLSQPLVSRAQLGMERVFRESLDDQLVHGRDIQQAFPRCMEPNWFLPLTSSSHKITFSFLPFWWPQLVLELEPWPAHGLASHDIRDMVWWKIA